MSNRPSAEKRQRTRARKLRNVLRSNGLPAAQAYAAQHGLGGLLAQLESKRKTK